VASPTRAASGQTEVTFATYNICKIECASGRFSWPNRRQSMVRNILAADPDVLAVQEADLGDDHWLDVRRLLRPGGYAIANTDVGDCTGACGAHIFYRTSEIELVSISGVPTSGMVSQRSLTPGAPWGAIKQDRTLSWALLRDKAGGAEFLAISIHLPNEKSGKGEQVRVAVAGAVSAWVERQAGRLGRPGIPTIVMGDLNSYDNRQPRGAQYVFRQAGFADAEDARARSHVSYSTVNTSTATAEYGGFPPRPPQYQPEGAKLDHIMAAGTPRAARWEVFLKLRPDGQFDERYRASDHNLVRAVIPIPG
jgi:endonuclease/exonuclease/phosphatase family metal-dependent hydrolase